MWKKVIQCLISLLKGMAETNNVIKEDIPKDEVKEDNKIEIKKVMTLKKGDRGEEVKKLQTLLGITADGDFGNKTDEAVRQFQRNNGLVVDGIVGPKTMFLISNMETPDFSILKEHLPEVVYNQIADTAENFNINTKLRMAHFLGQCAHESANFKFVSENLNYSAKALKSVFGKYFPGDLNEQYARNPEKIASRVYGGRMGNGDEETKEGWKYRGRGYIQLTGKNNYADFGNFINEDVVSNPDSVSEKYALSSAAFFFNKNKLWSICDMGSTEEIVKKLTKRVNGGDHGLDDRINKFNHFWNILK